MSAYTTESPASMAARARRRRALITIGILLLGLFFAFWYGLSYYQADQERRAAQPPPPTCRTYPPDRVVPADVTVNIYNATRRSGLAGRTSQQFTQRGFQVGKVANDPSSRKTPKVAEVRFGPKGKAAADLVLQVMPEGSKGVELDFASSGVSVALGTDFSSLGPLPEQTGLPACPTPSEEPSP